MRLQVMCERVRNHLKRIYVFAGKEIAAKGLGKLHELFFLATKSLLPFQITKMVNKYSDKTWAADSDVPTRALSSIVKVNEYV